MRANSAGSVKVGTKFLDSMPNKMTLAKLCISPDTFRIAILVLIGHKLIGSYAASMGNRVKCDCNKDLDSMLIHCWKCGIGGMDKHTSDTTRNHVDEEK
jgi:hypothetical protein